HPIDRTGHIIADAGIATIVSQKAKRETAERLGCEVVAADDPVVRSESTERLSRQEIRLSPVDLAYVLYTSGSTGRPKGVMTEHRNAVSFVASFNQVIRLTDDDRVFQGFSLGFDGSVEEIWMALSNGAALVVPAVRGLHVGNDLARMIDEGRATVFSTVPTSLSMISDSLSSVRLLIVSGERCPPEAVARWATRERRMLNVYGPTETTVNATAAECRPGEPVTIGSALPGYQLFILDEQGRPTAPGEKGELFIAGPGVARGYLNQPDLTARQFVELPPQASDAGARAYRTGDLVSYRDDGQLLFHGRIDDQVKVRGFRIELSEIEAVLTEVDAIRAAVVAVIDREGASELAAYVVAEEGRSVDRDALYSTLARRLPAYMIPSFLDELGVFPALSSGKADRKSLPAPKARFVRKTQTMRGPDTELEAIIARGYARAFENSAISVDDDFFLTLGGYSLVAARLVSDLRREARLEIAIRDVYDHPTIARLAAHIANRVATAGPPPSDLRVERTSSRRVFHSLPRVTRAGCVAAQAVGIYVMYAAMTLPYVGIWLLVDAWRDGALSLSQFAPLWLLLTAGSWPALILLSVAVKWIVIGRYKPGAYPVWGWYYFRFWLVRRFETLALPGLLIGTPLMSLYYRLMGAKVGRNCTIDTIHAAIFDGLTIGDDSSIGRETQLLGYHVESGALHIGSIHIGSGCFVGTHSALGLDVRMGDESRLDDQSLLPDGAVMLRGESRRGSPAKPGVVAVPPRPVGTAIPRRRALFGFLHLVELYALALLLLPVGIPSAAILYYAERSESPWWVAASIPVAGTLAIVVFCLWAVGLKRMVLPRLRPGVYRVESVFYLREWAVSFLMQMSRTLAKPIYTTIYLPAWFRLLGAKIGRRAEISTVSQISPDLTDIGDQSFFADGSMIAGRRLHRGMLELCESRIGRRSFVGNSAILPAGTSLGDGCLIGCLSAPPAGGRTPDGTEWLGSPSFSLPHRQKMGGFDESVTHEPTRKLVAQRLAIDALRIVIPSTIVTAQFVAFGYMNSYFREHLSLASWLLATPLSAMTVAAMGLVCVVLTKKLLIGTFRPTVKPLWSMFVWLNEVVNGTYETVAGPLLLPLLGTPFCMPWLRLLGCKIGRHVYMETTLFSEFDLVHIGDYAAINAGAIIQNHLFEDRIMKASTLKIGDECSVGNMAVVLYDTEMLPGSSIGPLSLLMKGETLPPETRWIGIPTAEISRTVTVPVVAPAVHEEAEARLLPGWG
ncbi:MAG TPA: Pls/PosA family non-ribosomal peptide synthetase, partial [Polyangiaceae bacterium]